MQLTKLTIDNHRFTLVIFSLLLFAGIKSFVTMPRTENPEIVIPGASVICYYPGASPVDLEELVASPIEEAINELDDIKKIKTDLIDGVAIITVEFDFNTDADEKYDELSQKITGMENDLPEEILDIYTWQWNSTDVAMLQLAMTSKQASYREIEQQAELLKNDLEKVQGVKKVEIIANPEQEVRVSLDLEKMAQMNITIEQVANAIKSNNANIPGGNINLGEKTFSVKTSGSISDLEQIRNTVVNSYMGRLIYLKNIAQVSFNHEDMRYYARYNLADNELNDSNEKAVFVIVKQKEGLNVLDITDACKPKIEDFNKTQTSDISVKYVFDQSVGVRGRINSFLGNLLQGIILVGLVIFIALGVKSAFVVIIAIPLSIVIGLAVVDYSGFGLQQISIAGLVVALGLLVDNSIVMVENINRHIAKGLKPREASISAATEIGWPIISATITTVLAFVPIAMMPDKAGEFIKSLPLTIIATLMISLVIALTLTPMITSKLFKGKKLNETNEPEKLKGFHKFLTKFIEGPYRKTLQFALNHRFMTISLAVGLLGISLFFFTFVNKSFFPKAEQPNLMIRISLPEGTNIDKTDQVARYVESVLDTIPEVKYYATNVGHGNPRIYYNVFGKNYTAHFAEIYVETHSYNFYEFGHLIDKLRLFFKDYPGAEINIKEFEQGPPVDAPIQIYLTGKELDKLSEISQEFEEELKKQPGAINVDNLLSKTKTDLYFNINREKANMFGIPIHIIDQTIRTAITGTTVSKYRDKDGKEYNLVLRMAYNQEVKMEDLDKIYINSLSGKAIPLSQLAIIEFRQAPSIITRFNLERTAELTADVEKGFVLDDVMKPVIEKLKSFRFPPGYGYHIGGELESRNETFGGMTSAVIIALIAIFAVLVLQFKSFVQPLIIYIAIPFAVIGMVWALLITGNPFSFTAFVGLTSLVGIVINNSIILVDFTNSLRKEGKSMTESLMIAGETRFTPIILTSFTTIGGLLPLTLGGGTLWAPLGWTMIGGLLVSTLLTLIVVPVFYKLLVRENSVDR